MKQSNTSSSGTLIAGTGTAGSGASQFNNPMGIYIDVNNRSIVYVVDSNNHRVQKWVIGGSSGVTVAGDNSSGTGLNQLNTPRAVISDSNGVLYISDTNNHRIMMWTLGATSGTVLVGTSGIAGSTATTLNYPNGVTFDANKNLYVADSNNFRVQMYSICTGNLNFFIKN